MLKLFQQNEVNRKILHILFAIYPISMNYINNDTNIIITIIFLFSVLIGDYICKKNKFLSSIFHRQKELSGEKKFSGAIFIAISSLILVVLCPKEVFIPSLLAISFCDTFSSLIGKHFGKHKIKYTNKSLEGFGGFCMGFIPIYLICHLLNVEILTTQLMIAVFISGLCELFLKIDDNLSVPLSFALTLIVIS